MATAKIVTLAIRTLAKPIATQLKQRATQHESFRKYMHRTEMRLRANLVPGSDKIKIRPLNDSKVLAAALILGETYRGKRSRANVRDKFEEKIEELHHQVEELKAAIPPGQQLSLPGREPPSNAGSSESQALYSLTESVQLLWKLAERHGWVDNKAFVQEMHWALDEEDKEAEQDKR
ncbi:hypothetical protein MOBT1_001763 [Malassezia obtusa]|uniref:Uncharacterized protein n=1 Tax=Malassezia obtusa TaxID=76774 RepID=A0AAF0E1X8_9BASI|nr:hypothetical protein MOBT1_001763 [Malassezia obtusa]